MEFPNKRGIRHGIHSVVKETMLINGIKIPSGTKIVTFRGQESGFISIPSMKTMIMVYDYID